MRQVLRAENKSRIILKKSFSILKLITRMKLLLLFYYYQYFCISYCNTISNTYCIPFTVSISREENKANHGGTFKESTKKTC